MQYVPWDADKQMPYNIIDLIESDETLATCQMFNAEVCYGSGFVYSVDRDESRVKGDEKGAPQWDANAALEFSIFRTGEYPVPSIIDTVNLIRTAKNGTFAEWKNSDTAKLYGMLNYENKKKSSGQFF